LGEEIVRPQSCLGDQSGAERFRLEIAITDGENPYVVDEAESGSIKAIPTLGISGREAGRTVRVGNT